MSVWTQERIAEYLNGTLRRLDDEGHYVTVDVPHDFIPAYRNASGGRPLGAKVQSKSWDDNEDTILRGLHKRGSSIHEIAQTLGRSDDSVAHRMRVLRASGKL